MLDLLREVIDVPEAGATPEGPTDGCVTGVGGASEGAYEFCWKAVTKILLLGRQRKCIALVEILGRLNDASIAPLRHVRHE